MAQGNFVTQDQCEYIHRDVHYHRSGILRHLKRKLRKLKVFIIITILAMAGGAGAVWLPEFLAAPPSVEQEDEMMEMLQEMKKNPEMMEKYKKQLERMK